MLLKFVPKSPIEYSTVKLNNIIALRLPSGKTLSEQILTKMFDGWGSKILIFCTSVFALETAYNHKISIKRWENDRIRVAVRFRWKDVILVKSHVLKAGVHISQPNMMTSLNGNIFRVTGPLWGEFTGQRWITLTKASDAELWCLFFICA